jgi:hypothetical protein
MLCAQAVHTLIHFLHINERVEGAEVIPVSLHRLLKFMFNAAQKLISNRTGRTHS